MNISAPFIARPVATVLLTLAVALVGIAAYALLPVSPLPQIDFPTIRIQANLPGASPETMAATVATPLERTLGRIAGISEMTSQSSLGTTGITLVFDLDRDINGAARDVQAAINAARATLPTLPSNPTYRKLNPADAPIMILALTSDSVPIGKLYDIGSTVLSQKISQIYGVGQVQVSGSSLPAIRVELTPDSLNLTDIALESVRASIARANVNTPKGVLDNGENQWFIGANDQLSTASDFSKVIIRYNDGANLRLGDAAAIKEDVQDTKNMGFANGKPAVLLIIYKEPGANIVSTVEQINKNLPLLRSWMPEGVDFVTVMDRSPSIKASLRDVEQTLVIAMCLVILVVFLFLRNARATAIPAVAVPVSLLGTFAIIYMLGYSLNHLSLMALTIATGFVVDDAIVVTENIVRHIENGISPLKAAYKGSQEVAFTVVSISLSLVAIFIPILAMGGFLGRMFKEFAVTLSVAILVSLVVSLVATPMMCALFLHAYDKPDEDPREKNAGCMPMPLVHFFSIFTTLYHKGIALWTHFMDSLHEGYAKTLAIVLRHRRLTLLSLVLTIVCNIYLYVIVPKGFFPQQDTGMMIGMVQADQSISFQAMRPKMLELAELVRSNPAVASVGGFAGGRQLNSGFMFISLKPRSERKKPIAEVITELHEKVTKLPGADLRLAPLQDIGASGRRTRAANQYTFQSDTLALLKEWSAKALEKFKTIEGMTDVNSDQETRGLQTTVEVDRGALARLGLTQKQVDTALGLAYGQVYASTMFTYNNQYRVVMEYSKDYQESAESLSHLYVPTQRKNLLVSFSSLGTGASGNTGTSISNTPASGPLVPLHSFSHTKPGITALSVSHQGQMAATTLSFNLAPGYSLSQIQEKIDLALHDLGMPENVRGSFQGTAKMFTDSIRNQPLLILAALITLYIVLGILYESLIHPLTILSTLPSAGVGALLALLLCKTEFTVIAFIGVLLLCGIVKKNAILMVDFAIAAKRHEGLSPTDAIYKACLLRFRPIMMTTMAAMFGAVPLIVSFGEGSELRTPLGITIIGGLFVSQLLTLYTTPVVYLYLDKFTRDKHSSFQKQIVLVQNV